MLYRILVADDEALEREGMRWIIDHMVDQPTEVIEAGNGRDALQQASIHKPHIIFMDIRMPGMDGLAALRAIRQLLPQAKFVLVTAYEYFDYAQEAVRLGAKDYIVKPANRQEIAALVKRLIAEIELEQEAARSQQAKEQRLQELLPLVKAELALRLISAAANEQELLAIADSLQLELEGLCAVVVALPQGEQHRQLLEQQVQQLLQQQASIHGYDRYISSPFVHEHIVLFLTAREAERDKPEALLQHARSVSCELLERCKQTIPEQEVQIGIGNKHESVAGARRSYFEAVFASTTAVDSSHVCLFQDIEHLSPQPLLSSKAEHYAYVQQAIKLIQQEREQQTFSMIDAALSYIARNYQRELLLEEVAEHVHLNPYYFSKVFKQQTGETFIDYITRIRIEKAKQWMGNKEMSLKEICYLVGYNDPNYFSRVFKKVTGMTPSAYRSQQ